MKNMIAIPICIGVLVIGFSCRTPISIYKEAQSEIKFKDFSLTLNLILGADNNKNNKFKIPYSVVTDKNGNIYVADKDNHRIQIYTSEGECIKTIGRNGKGHVEFFYPRDLDLDDKNNLYILDYDKRKKGNRRIHILSNEGKVINSFDIPIKADQIIVADNFIYVTNIGVDSSKYLVFKLSKTGKIISAFGNVLDKKDILSTRIHNEVNITSDIKDNLYLAYRFVPKVKKYSLDGKLLMEFEYQPSIKNKKQAFEAEEISRRTKSIVTPEGVKMVGTLKMGMKTHPICYDIAVDNSGVTYLLVAKDHGKDESCTIYRFDSSGRMLEKIDLSIRCARIYIDFLDNFYFLSPTVSNLLIRYTSK